MKYFKTSEVAKAVGLHPNTIRLYEQWGLLPEISRTAAGYRLFTQEHMDQVKLVRLVLKCTVFGREIKHTAYEIIKLSAHSDYSEALGRAGRLEALLRNECRQAEEAEHFLEEWGSRRYTFAGGNGQSTAGTNAAPAPASPTAPTASNAGLSRNDAAKMLDITPDTLRDWERNGLISIPRDSRNGYRRYGADDINKLRVIRVLRRSNYSNMAILRAIQKLEAGSAEGLMEVLDSPETDEERGYLCFTDTLLTSLYAALDAVCEIIRLLRDKSDNK